MRLQLEPNENTVQVFCRIRPMSNISDVPCLKVMSNEIVALTPPEKAVNYKLGSLKETHYTFQHIFNAESRQNEIYEKVAKPLVESLILGNNGLLFTYGVTGSGKTFTMTGDSKRRGIMPRCLEALFDTISKFQTELHTFLPDKMNGFEISPESCLHREYQENDNNCSMKQTSDSRFLFNYSNTENKYAVFITYIEVYNNSVYDLLEESSLPNRNTFQSRVIREDGNHNMYVHGVTEIEVKSVEEALNIFSIGQKRKRIEQTVLNAESSRSHSVFTMRLVQITAKNLFENNINEGKKPLVSQLSLVDLAGSERLSRTNNTGQRLREAGNINNSLMTLRTCLEILRENQKFGMNKKVPYRESKLTNLFKYFFDGGGDVRMIVCVNPRTEDYDENAQVLKFAEITQDVQLIRQTPRKIIDQKATPGRRKVQKIVPIIYENKIVVNEPFEFFEFPKFSFHLPEKTFTFREVINALDLRIQKRSLMLENVAKSLIFFRFQLMEQQKHFVTSRSETLTLKAALKMEQEKSENLERKQNFHEKCLDDINKHVNRLQADNVQLKKRIENKQALLIMKNQEQEHQKQTFDVKIGKEKNKMQNELEEKLKLQRKKIEEKYKSDVKKLALVSDILNAHETHTAIKSTKKENSTSLVNTTLNRGIAVANPKYRRSKSADRWLEHRARCPVNLGTIFQPFYQTRKSVTYVEESDLVNKNTSKYCLVDQAADENGDIETKLYKGEIVPTIAGGAQVIFNDVEYLKQISPVPKRKRPNSTPVTPHEQEAKLKKL